MSLLNLGITGLSRVLSLTGTLHKMPCRQGSKVTATRISKRQQHTGRAGIPTDCMVIWSFVSNLETTKTEHVSNISERIIFFFEKSKMNYAQIKFNVITNYTQSGTLEGGNTVTRLLQVISVLMS